MMGEVSMGGQTVVRWLLVLLLLYSLGSRLWVAALDPTESRYWDERYSLENVRAVLDDKERAPVNAFHPSLSYLPQAVLLWVVEELHEATGWSALLVRTEEGFSELSYLLARALQVVYGTLSVLALYFFSRWCLSPGASLAAAAVLAAVPWHVRQSTIFKPDILLLLFIVLALHWSARALDEGRWTEFSMAGLWIGMAMSSKYNGVLGLVPLAIAVLHAGKGAFPRRVAQTTAAAAVAMSVFTLLNIPLISEPELVERDFGRTLRDYERKSVQQEAGSLDVPLHAIESVVSGAFFGPVIGLFCLVGLVYLAVLIASRRRSAIRSRGTIAISFWFTVSYIVFYSLITSNLSEHNWLPLTPVLAFAAAALGEALWIRLGLQVPARSSALSFLLIAAVIGAIIIVPSFIYVYRSAVPSGLQLAQHYVRRTIPPEISLRLIYQGGLSQWILLEENRRTSGLRLLETPSALSGEALDRADAEVYDVSWTSADFLSERLQRFPAEARGVWFSQPFRIRPPSVVAIAHPWRLVPPAHSLTWVPSRRAFECPELDLPEGSLVSLEVDVPLEANAHAFKQARVGTLAVLLFPTGRRRQSRRLISERFEISCGDEVRVEAEEQPYPREIWLWVWEPGRVIPIQP